MSSNLLVANKSVAILSQGSLESLELIFGTLIGIARFHTYKWSTF